MRAKRRECTWGGNLTPQGHGLTGGGADRAAAREQPVGLADQCGEVCRLEAEITSEKFTFAIFPG